jgi:hypothetical protein
MAVEPSRGNSPTYPPSRAQQGPISLDPQMCGPQSSIALNSSRLGINGQVLNRARGVGDVFRALKRSLGYRRPSVAASARSRPGLVVLMPFEPTPLAAHRRQARATTIGLQRHAVDGESCIVPDAAVGVSWNNRQKKQALWCVQAQISGNSGLRTQRVKATTQAFAQVAIPARLDAAGGFFAPADTAQIQNHRADQPTTFVSGPLQLGDMA